MGSRNKREGATQKVSTAGLPALVRIAASMGAVGEIPKFPQSTHVLVSRAEGGVVLVGRGSPSHALHVKKAQSSRHEKVLRLHAFQITVCLCQPNYDHGLMPLSLGLKNNEDPAAVGHPTTQSSTNDGHEDRSQVFLRVFPGLRISAGFRTAESGIVRRLKLMDRLRLEWPVGKASSTPSVK